MIWWQNLSQMFRRSHCVPAHYICKMTTIFKICQIPLPPGLYWSSNSPLTGYTFSSNPAPLPRLPPRRPNIDRCINRMLFYKHKNSFILPPYVRVRPWGNARWGILSPYARARTRDVTPMRTYATSSTYAKTADVFWRENLRWMGCKILLISLKIYATISYYFNRVKCFEYYYLLV
jgi:hypothetical protein